MDESPIFSRTSRKSRYSLYQSDYETAGEDSDGSLYYSILDESKENDLGNKENSMNPHNGTAGRQSLLEKCLQKNLNLTPRNEFNKRVSFNVNPFLISTSVHSPVIAVNSGIGSQITKIMKSEDEDAKKSLSMNVKTISLHTQTTTSSITDSLAEMFNDETVSTNDAGTYVSSDVIDVIDQSLNSTMVADFDNLPEVEPEATIDVVNEVNQDVPVSKVAAISTSTLTFDSKTASFPEDPSPNPKQSGQATNQNIPPTFGLLNIPHPTKITLANLSDLQALTYSPTLPSRLSPDRGRSTEIFGFSIPKGKTGHSTDNFGFSKPKGKTGIPKVSLMLARNNSILHTSAIPVSSLKCQHCDKSFAKKIILDVHLLEKCEKIPPARRRQLSRQTCSNMSTN